MRNLKRARSQSRRRPERRRLRFEPLEPRVLLAGDTYLVNFQLAGAPVPTRYMTDTGSLFGVRPNGLSYGWLSPLDHTDQARDRDLLADQRLDTLIHFEAGATWEFQLANGVYEVTVTVGDPANDEGIHTINVEGVNFINAVADMSGSHTVTQQVTVSDGRLTVDQGTAADKATRINYLHIVNLPSGPNNAPSNPTILEPIAEGHIVNRGDVHMEVSGYSDANGDLHKSTDWEIWTTGAGAEPVWQTLGIEGGERLHTHLGDGVFINSAAGVGLQPNTDYQLRVRFRDDGGAVSGYATRGFHTAADTTAIPLQLTDIASSGVTWTSLSGNVILPNASPTKPEVRVETAGESLLLRIRANNGVTNTVTNPAALGEHDYVRVVMEAGSSALSLPQTDLTFFDEQGLQHTIYLPAASLAAGQRVYLWVATNGATYYGTEFDVVPVFTSLARASDSLVPYLAMKPGFVIEEVAGGMSLPVNIAFVPNPGPNPQNPYFYVTELYGAIKVVTRDFTVHTFASGLLNFDPTGAFPGSGEQGLTGIVVDIEDIDPGVGVDLRHVVYATRVWDTSSANGSAEPHHPQVIRFVATANGLAASGAPTIIRDMVGENQGQSHQVSNITFGPDGKLYVHMGDGFDATTARNLNSYRGKILRMNRDGTAPSDNPFYNASNGITARDYVYAYGLRNPFGGAWRASDGKHYEVENGPTIDRFVQINPGVDYLWDGDNDDMLQFALYNWNPAHAPVNLTYIQPQTFAGSQFPASMMDHAFVSESGPTLGIGQQTLGKRIVEFTQNAAGAVTAGPSTLIDYAGIGAGSVVGLAAGPDGLYFTTLYNNDATSQAEIAVAIGPGAKVYRVRYVNPLVGDYNINGNVDSQDYNPFRSAFGSNYLLAADGNRDNIVDAADYVAWRKFAGGAGASPASAAVEASSSTQHVAAEVADETANSVTASIELAFIDFATGDEIRSPRSATRSTQYTDTAKYRHDLLLSHQVGTDDETVTVDDHRFEEASQRKPPTLTDIDEVFSAISSGRSASARNRLGAEAP